MKRKLYSFFSLAVILSVISLKAQASASTDFFRSMISGNWNTPSTWESSATSEGPYQPATLAPTSASAKITIRSNDTVTLTDSRLIDQVIINGTLVVNPNVYIQLNDGQGTDLTISTVGKIILRSDITGAAGIDDLTKYGNATIEQHNNITQERYFIANRAWRLLTAPLRSSQNDVNIFESWQNNGVYEPGRGTFVTAPAGGTAEGIDANRRYSIKTFDMAYQSTLIDVNNTKTTSLFTTAPLIANNSYFVFVRGDRDPANLTIPNTNATTLSATGELQTGQQTFAASANAGEFALVGNPYAALVDFARVGRNNMYDRFYAFDPTIGEVGAYTLVDRPEGQTLYSVSVPSSQQTSVIQINQAVFVQTLNSGNSSIVFDESTKTTVGNTAGVFRVEESKLPSFTSNLLGVYEDNTTKLFDGNKVLFSADFSAGIDKMDAPKLSNFNENLGLARSGATLAMEKRPAITGTDTVFLKLWNTTARNYQLQFIAANFSPAVTAFLEDSYLKTSTALSLGEPALVSFRITADAASADPNRFKVVFKVGQSLPVNFTNIKASQKNSAIQVDWSIFREENISTYEVEKSKTGKDFAKAGSVSAGRNTNATESYNWIDATPFNGNNFYRIKVISKSGIVTYSQVINVKIGTGKGDITVYPNPVQGKIINLQLYNQSKGTYTVQLFNNAGQKVFGKTIEHAGGSSSQTLHLNKNIAKGTYQLLVTDGTNKINRQVICD